MYGAYIKRKEKEDINHEINPLFIIRLTKYKTIHQLMVKAKHSVNRTFSLLAIIN